MQKKEVMEMDTKVNLMVILVVEAMFMAKEYFTIIIEVLFPIMVHLVILLVQNNMSTKPVPYTKGSFGNTLVGHYISDEP